MTTKRISIIPGFTHKPTDERYKWLVAYFEKKGFRVQLITIDWKYRVMSDYVAQFKAQYAQNPGRENCVLGFSFGAMVAMIAAGSVQVDKLILCSLSPYFKEDVASVPKSWLRYIGTKRVADFTQYSAKRVAKRVTAPTIIFCGGREAERFPNLLQRCTQAARDIPGAELVIADNAPHEIDFPVYVEAIKKHLHL